MTTLFSIGSRLSRKRKNWFRQRSDGSGDETVIVTVQTAVEQYLEMRDARETARAGRMIRSNASHRLGVHVLSDKKLMKIQLASLCENDLREWQVRHGAIKPTTLRRLIGDLKAGLNMAYTRYRSTLPPDLPTVIKYGLQMIDRGNDGRVVARDNQILTDDQVRRIIEVAREQDTDGDVVRVIVLLAATGARFSQLARMRVGDVQVENSRVMIPKSRKGRGKDGGHIRVPVGSDVITLLQPAVTSRPPEAPLLERWYYRRIGYNRFERDRRAPWKAAYDLADPWRKVVAAAGLIGTIPYSLRHSSIVRSIGKGLPIRLVAALHDTSVEMIERHYSRWITEGLDELAAQAIVPLVA